MSILNKKTSFKSGALPDNRPQEKKNKDYQQKELVASIAPVKWEYKTKYRSYPIRKQNGSGSCVMQSLEKERGIIAQQKYGEFIVFSCNAGYQLRANTEISGSTLEDSINATKHGAIPESLSPSQSMTDQQMMKAVLPKYEPDLAKIFGAKRIFIEYDIDAIASTIENTEKGVGLTIRFGNGEWFRNSEVKQLLPESGWQYGHRVCIVDYTLNKKGVKCLVIEDSACEDGYPVRLVPESFFKARTYWQPSYILNFKTYEEVGVVPVKPKFDGSIKSFQDCMKFLKLFPANVDSTGVYGNISRGACIEYQKMRNITPALGNLGDITKGVLFAEFN